ncbi:hypothetical protein B0H19DRAFT_1386228 [Mycena capillaripes]|nr:hypothetical protein B0H19DRAFT_1386228 [Mycena capillaripes]
MTIDRTTTSDYACQRHATPYSLSSRLLSACPLLPHPPPTTAWNTSTTSASLRVIATLAGRMWRALPTSGSNTTGNPNSHLEELNAERWGILTANSQDILRDLQKLKLRACHQPRLRLTLSFNLSLTQSHQPFTPNYAPKCELDLLPNRLQAPYHAPSRPAFGPP